MSVVDRVLASSAACLFAGLLGVASAQEIAGPGFGLVDAVRLTLEKQPGIRLAEEQLRFAEGSLQAELGAFDFQLGTSLTAARTQAPVLPGVQAPGSTDSKVDSLTYLLQGSKLFKSGLLITPSLDLGKQTSSAAVPSENRSRVFFTLRQPLLRGKGEEGVGAPPRIALSERDATALDLRHAVSLSVLETVAAYWRYVSETRRLQIARDSETRFVDLLATTQKLLAAREIAAVDIKQVSAVVASRRLSRLEAEQSVNAARVRLGVATGLDALAIGAIGQPGDPLPAVSGSESDLATLMSVALVERADLQAARYRQTSLGVALSASRNAARPTLDVVLGAGYLGATERSGLPGLFDPLGTWSGPSASASVVFGWPGANRTALGRLAENQAALRQQEIGVGDLERRIGAQVVLAVSNLSKSAARVAAAREACDIYRETLAAERQRQQLGLSTLLDVITTEDRLNDSLTEQVSAELDYADAVAALRFETGTLLRTNASGHEVDLVLLTTPPAPGPAR